MESSTTTTQASHFRFKTASWLERMPGHLANATSLVYSSVAFLGNGAVIIATFGPSLFYKLYGPNQDEEGETSFEERYYKMIGSLVSEWKGYSTCLQIVIGILFAIVLTLKDPLCSVTGFAALMTCAAGFACVVAFAVVFKDDAEALRNNGALNEWSKASKKSWREVPNQSFWVMLFLPTIGSWLSGGLSIMAIVLWVRGLPVAGTTLGVEQQVCSTQRLLFFKYTLLVTLVAIIALVAFIKLRLMKASTKVSVSV